MRHHILSGMYTDINMQGHPVFWKCPERQLYVYTHLCICILYTYIYIHMCVSIYIYIYVCKGEFVGYGSHVYCKFGGNPNILMSGCLTENGKAPLAPTCVELTGG